MHKILFYNKFIICLYMFQALCAHHQEVKKKSVRARAHAHTHTHTNTCFVKVLFGYARFQSVCETDTVVFWNITPCNFIGECQCFGEMCCSYLQKKVPECGGGRFVLIPRCHVTEDHTITSFVKWLYFLQSCM